MNVTKITEKPDDKNPPFWAETRPLKPVYFQA